MRDFYSFRFLSRTILPALLAGLLLIGSTDTAKAQQHRPSMPNYPKLFEQQTLKTKQAAFGSLKGSMAKYASAATITKPLTSMQYEFIEASWHHTTTNTYTYDDMGRVTSLLEKYSDGTNSFRETYVYDQYGNEIENKFEQWTGTNWEVAGGWQTLHTYDTNGRITETIEKDWNDNAWELSHRTVYTYNASGDLLTITEYSREDSTWLIDESYNLTYASPNTPPTSLTYMEPNENGTLESVERAIDLVWHNFSNAVSANMFFEQNIAGYIYQDWENGQWVTDEKYEAIYGENNSYVGVYQDWVNDGWVNDWRTTVTYDAQGNLTLNQEELWGWTGPWVMYDGDKYMHTYNATNNLVETIRQSWDANAFRNFTRTVYSNFQVVTSAPAETEALIAEVYPNPTADRITLSYKQSPGQATLQVTDMTGKVILKKQLSPGSIQQQVDLTTFPAGLYMLQLHSGNVVATRKVMKL